MTLRSLGLVAFVVAVGCRGGAPLDRVPIDGGTAEQRAAAREALADFERWAGEGRVRLKEVAFEDFGGEYLGRYRTMSRIVEVRASLPPSEVHDVVIHELCHAIDFQEGLKLRDTVINDLLDLVLEYIESNAMDIDRVLPHRSTLGGRRGEVFARLCETGPSRARFASKPCPGDDPVVAAAASFVNERVWRGDTDLIGWAPAGEVVTWEAPVPFVHPFVLGAHGSFWIELLDDEENELWPFERLSVEDASPMPDEAPYFVLDQQSLVREPGALPEGIPEDPYPYTWAYPNRRRVEGFEAYFTPPFGVNASVGPAAFLGHRVVVEDERGWWASEACPNPDYAPDGRMQGMIGAVDGVLYAVWKHGQAVSWQRLTPLVGESAP